MSSHYTPYYVAFCQCFEELADLEEDCPACSQDNRQTLEHLKSLDQIENLDQQFFRCVENAPDPFTAVADFFAKGLYFVCLCAVIQSFITIVTGLFGLV